LADVLAGGAHGSWIYNPLPASVTSRPGYIRSYDLMDVPMLYVNSTLPPFNDLSVRQALNYALDRPRVMQTLHGPGGVVGPLTCQLLPPSIPAYRPDCPYQTGPADQPYQGRNLVKGRELAAASGTLGVPITVHQSTRYAYLVNLAEAAASTLRELGYHVEIEEIPPEHRSNSAEDPAYGTYQIFSQGGWGGDYASPANFYDNVVSCRVHNISHYCNPTIDAKAQAAQALRANDPGGVAQGVDRGGPHVDGRRRPGPHREPGRRRCRVAHGGQRPQPRRVRTGAVAGVGEVADWGTRRGRPSSARS
jgi:ABC-type transport system substrate-binding protein